MSVDNELAESRAASSVLLNTSQPWSRRGAAQSRGQMTLRCTCASTLQTISLLFFLLTHTTAWHFNLIPRRLPHSSMPMKRALFYFLFFIFSYSRHDSALTHQHLPTVHNLVQTCISSSWSDANPGSCWGIVTLPSGCWKDDSVSSDLKGSKPCF